VTGANDIMFHEGWCVIAQKFKIMHAVDTPYYNRSYPDKHKFASQLLHWQLYPTNRRRCQ